MFIISTLLRMKKIFTIFAMFTSAASLLAQSYIRIHQKDGGHTDFPISLVDSITLVDGDSLPTAVGLVGEWLWGSADAGYYELLTLNDDHTYTGYDNYFTYGFDTMTYGWWGQIGAMLTLQSNGFGYQRRYNWYVMGLSSNALEVMTKMGPFIYYRLQPEPIHLKVGGEPATCQNGDTFVFADGAQVSVIDNKLYGVASGTTYIQKYVAATQTILAYKVIVE